MIVFMGVVGVVSSQEDTVLIQARFSDNHDVISVIKMEHNVEIIQT